MLQREAGRRSELQGSDDAPGGQLRLAALQKRALSEGVSADVVDDTMDGDAPKASLIALIVAVAASRGPSNRLLSALQAGGEAAADALTRSERVSGAG